MAVICVFFSKKKASKNHSLTRESNQETQHESGQKRCTWLYLAGMQQIKRKYQETSLQICAKYTIMIGQSAELHHYPVTHGNVLEKKVFLSGISIPQKEDINQQLLTGTDRACNDFTRLISSIQCLITRVCYTRNILVNGVIKRHIFCPVDVDSRLAARNYYDLLSYCLQLLQLLAS